MTTKYMICDIDGCTIDDSHRLHLINPEKHDFDAYHQAMVKDKDALPIGKAFIEYAIENKIGLVFFTAAPEIYRGLVIDRLERVYGLGLSRYKLVMRHPRDLRPSAQIKEEMLKVHFPEGTQNIIAAIDDHYDVVDMYRRNYIPAYVVNKDQLIDSATRQFRDLILTGNANVKFATRKKYDIYTPFQLQMEREIIANIGDKEEIVFKEIIIKPDNLGAAHEKFTAPAFLPAEELEGTQDGTRGNEHGRKFDSEKLRFSLLPVDALEEVVKVLEFGAKKYSEGNWKKVDNADQRYYDAALRHMILGSGSGELDDPETKMKHTAHAICCLLFKLHFELEADKDGAGNS